MGPLTDPGDPFESFFIRQLFRFFEIVFNSTYIYTHILVTAFIAPRPTWTDLLGHFTTSFVLFHFLLVDSFAVALIGRQPCQPASVVVPLIPRIMKLINETNTARP